jgi:hypothetical protein
MSKNKKKHKDILPDIDRFSLRKGPVAYSYDILSNGLVKIYQFIGFDTEQEITLTKDEAREHYKVRLHNGYEKT